MDGKMDRITELLLQLGRGEPLAVPAVAVPVTPAGAAAAADPPVARPDAPTVMRQSLMLQANEDFRGTLKGTTSAFFRDCIAHKQFPGTQWKLEGLTNRQAKSKCKLVFSGIVALAAPHEERYFDYRQYVHLDVETHVEWARIRNELITRLTVSFQRQLASRMLVARRDGDGEPTEAEITKEIRSKKTLVGALGSYATRVQTEEKKKAAAESNKRRRRDDAE